MSSKGVKRGMERCSEMLPPDRLEGVGSGIDKGHDELRW